jgi:hypothetical protein
MRDKRSKILLEDDDEEDLGVEGTGIEARKSNE